MLQLLRFAWIELTCCAFAIVIFAGLGVSGLVWNAWDIPVARYDVLLGYVLVVQVLFVAAGLETWRELLVICAFHLIGLALEVFKVSAGSWSYPEPGLLRIAGVPVFSGFMYAAVGSYICQAFRRLDLRVTKYRLAARHPLRGGCLPELLHPPLHRRPALVDRSWDDPDDMGHVGVFHRRPEAVPDAPCPVLPADRRGAVGGRECRDVPGSLEYPDQLAAWQLVHVGKLGSWALLVVLSFVLVTGVKAYEGTLYGDRPSRIETTPNPGDRCPEFNRPDEAV